MFKVGDTVRVTNMRSSYNGMVGKIVEIEIGIFWDYVVVFSENHKSDTFNAKELVKYDEV